MHSLFAEGVPFPSVTPNVRPPIRNSQSRSAYLPAVNRMHLRLHGEFRRFRVFEYAKAESPRDLPVRVLHHIRLLDLSKLGEVLLQRLYLLSSIPKARTVRCFER